MAEPKIRAMGVKQARRVKISVIVEVHSSESTSKLLDQLKERVVHVTNWSSFGIDGYVTTHEAGERSIEILDDEAFDV